MCKGQFSSFLNDSVSPFLSVLMLKTWRLKRLESHPLLIFAVKHGHGGLNWFCGSVHIDSSSSWPSWPFRLPEQSTFVASQVNSACLRKQRNQQLSINQQWKATQKDEKSSWLINKMEMRCHFWAVVIYSARVQQFTRPKILFSNFLPSVCSVPSAVLKSQRVLCYD